MTLRFEEKSGLKMPDKDNSERNQTGLKVPERKPWIVLQEKNGIKLVKDESATDQKYMIIGGYRIYKYRSVTWAKKSHERMVEVNEKSQF